MTKIELTIKRANGNVEKVDITKHHSSMNQILFNKIKKDTSDAGRGIIQKAEYTHTVCNLKSLMENYNNINNEGFDGYIPGADYFKALPEFVETEVTEIFN